MGKSRIASPPTPPQRGVEIVSSDSTQLQLRSFFPSPILYGEVELPMANQLSAQPKGRTRGLMNGKSGQHPLLLERDTPIPYSSPSVNSRECLTPPCAIITSWFAPSNFLEKFASTPCETNSREILQKRPQSEKTAAHEID